MGSRGPAPTPTEILKIRGSWRADTRKGEPQPKKGRPKAPRLSAEAKKLWVAITKLLSETGVLTQIDGGQIERYCVYFVRWREVETLLERFGGANLGATLLKEESRVLYKQATIESHRLDGALKHIESQFGLTPAARARLTMPGEGEQDELDTFLKKHG